MKRNRFGINVDEGVALTTHEEFEQLFVDTESDAKNRLLEWLKDGDRPSVFGGQIGCGKTTLLQYCFQESQCKPDITFHFDSGSLNLSAIDSWSIVFAELFLCIADLDLIGMDEISAEYKVILGDTPEAWQESLMQIRLQLFSQVSVEKNKAFNRVLEANEEYLPDFLDALIKKISLHNNASLILFASGIDKFEPGTAAYFTLTDILKILCSYKTLFEVNAVHLFCGDPWIRQLEKIIITASTNKQIEEMLLKRLGRYKGSYTNGIPLIAKYSGGMPRQAVRLLDSFLAEQKQHSGNSEAFFQAAENINRDFFAFSQRPENTLMQVVNQNHFLEMGLVALPGDEETAKRAVFGNWLVVGKHMQESRWEANVNPLIKESFVEVAPEEPERVLLKEYARKTGISEQGLDIDILQDGWQNTLLDQLETPIELNVTEILDSISSALLSKQRADRIIVAFDEPTVANAVRAYFEAKSNAYEYQVWYHHVLGVQGDDSPLIEMIQHFSEDAVDVYSFEFAGDLSADSLNELNIRRDSFVDKQLIWWIPREKLRFYLGQWTQLRQLFQVYVLEEDLTRSLNMNDIESDLDFMGELVESEGTAPFSYVENLKTVLNYLKEMAHG